MRSKVVWFASITALILAGTVSRSEDVESISRPDIAAANCPTEWAALVSMEPNLWADTNPIEIDPSLDQATTEAINKYFLAIMASAEHISSLVGFASPERQTQEYFDEAKAKYDLSTCLTLTQTERDLVTESAKLAITSASEDEIRAALFEAFDQYECMAFERASDLIFRLNPQSATFSSDYDEIMSTTLKVCD